jgi:hypothetical protein
MESKLVLIHTLSSLVDAFNRLGGELLPGIQLVHIEEATRIASDWLYNNPNRFYNLGLPRYEI